VVAENTNNMQTLKQLLPRANIHGRKNSEPEIVVEKKPITAASKQEKQKFPPPNPSSFWNIPADLQLKLTEYLEDDELFEARTINRIFYRGFYEQKVVSKTRNFNYSRALKLAKIGRVFKNLEYFQLSIGYTVSSAFAKNLNPLHFPAFHHLDLEIDTMGCVDDIPINPNIRKVRIRASVFAVDIKRFPNLEELICGIEVTVLVKRHPQLKVLDCHCHSLMPAENLTTENFPALEKVVFHIWKMIFNNEDVYTAARRLRADGVNVTCLES